jgi:PAS domain S-box-containing protein
MKKTLPADDRFSIIADAAQDAMIMMDSVGRVSFWNDAAERILVISERKF